MESTGIKKRGINPRKIILNNVNFLTLFGCLKMKSLICRTIRWSRGDGCYFQCKAVKKKERKIEFYLMECQMLQFSWCCLLGKSPTFIFLMVWVYIKVRMYGMYGWSVSFFTCGPFMYLLKIIVLKCYAKTLRVSYFIDLQLLSAIVSTNIKE